MGERRQGFRLARPAAGGRQDGIKKLAARRERDAGAVVAPHAIDSQSDHGTQL
jgi:hypothetical protein